MRTFRDPNNTDWVVFEVRREVSAKGDWSYLPGGFSDGWLCFESVGAKRRLVRYPERWKEFTDAQLQDLLAKASPAPRTALRLGDDLDDTSRNARAE
jgi:hypothetical protein